jgi:hypothetical protein
MIYKGSCHCGDIAFEVEGQPTQVMACDCSIPGTSCADAGRPHE